MIPYLVFASSKDIGTDLPEHLLITDTISTKISCTCPYTYASPLVKSVYQKNIFSYFSTKQSYVVGTQKNRLNETVLLSTQNIC